jgi:hypothetical protein
MVDLDKRLEKLKQGYEEMPTLSSPQKLIDGTMRSQHKAPKKNKWLTHLPYVASFIGVLLIGTILTRQFFIEPRSVGERPIGQVESDKNSPIVIEEVTDEDIALKHQKLVDFYNEEKLKFEEQIDHPNVEKFPFVQEAKKLVDLSPSPSFKVYQNKEDLEQSFKDYTEFVRNRFELPKTDIEQLDAKIESMAQGDNVSQDIVEIIHKQNELLMHFNSQLNTEDFYAAIDYEDYQGSIDRLNQLEIQNENLLLMAKNFIENGYHFVNQGEGMVGIDIDYSRILDQYGPHLTSPIKRYLEIKKSPRVAFDASILISWEELAGRIIEMEEILKTSSETPKDMIVDDYFFYLNLYLHGADNTPAFGFLNDTLDPDLKQSYEEILSKHPGTETYNIISDYYQLLQKGNFQPQAVEGFKVDIDQVRPQLVGE